MDSPQLDKYGDEMLTIHEIAKREGITKQGVDARIRRGVVLKQGGRKSTRSAKKQVEYKGKMYTYPELAELSGQKLSTIINRIRLGWSVEDAADEPLRETMIRKRNGRRSAPLYSYMGDMLTSAEIAEIEGITPCTATRKMGAPIKHNKPKPAPRAAYKKPHASIADVARAAAEQGLTYGQYVARMEGEDGL